MTACIPLSRVHDLESSALEGPLRVVAGGPVDETDQPSRILYVVDSAIGTPMTIEVVRALLREGSIVPTLVVGVGPPVDSREDMARYATRGRISLLRPPGEGIDPFVAAAFPGQPDPAADRFLTAIVDDVDPWVRRTWPVSPSPAALFGQSYGALFAMHVLAEQPTAIRDFAIISPGTADERSATLARFTTAAPGSLSGRVHLTVAEGEQPWARTAGGRMGVLYRRIGNGYHVLCAALARQPDIELATLEAPASQHETSSFQALTHALRFVLAPVPTSTA